MLIGIIGAGLSGLAAGRELARAGHEVIVFEKSKGFGGRVATRYGGENQELKFDHGCPHLSGTDARFTAFLDELKEKELVTKWSDGFHFWNGQDLLSRHPEKQKLEYYAAPEGLNSIGKYLSRWLDVRLESKVIGFTYLGDKRRNKCPWMINFENFNVVEVDALVIAVPSVQANGLIENSQDETYFKSVISKINEINYNPKFSLMLTYTGFDAPEWKGIHCSNSRLNWISNESSKRKNDDELTLVCHSEGDYTRERIVKRTDMETVRNDMVKDLRSIVGDWAGKYDYADIHLWRYSQPDKIMNDDFMEVGNANAPVALVGDYMRGRTAEQAYISGFEFGKYWAEQLNK